MNPAIFSFFNYLFIFFVVVAIYIFLAALSKAKRTSERLSSNDVESSSGTSLTVVSYSMCLGALSIGTILWLI